VVCGTGAPVTDEERFILSLIKKNIAIFNQMLHLQHISTDNLYLAVIFV